ncbi:MAG: hypothetical protein HUU46_05570 [Candidatus Hydrogenedentes bacterium]|nr:hypothetical protein [Candidatus Hydrogenedentota bacterium]
MATHSDDVPNCSRPVRTLRALDTGFGFKVVTFCAYLIAALMSWGWGINAVYYYASPPVAIPELDAVLNNRSAKYVVFSSAILMIVVLVRVAMRITRSVKVMVIVLSIIIALGVSFSCFIFFKQYTWGERRTMDNAAPIIVALAQYRSEHGRYPEFLWVLVPQYIDAILRDGFLCFTMGFWYEPTGNPSGQEYYLSASHGLLQDMEYYSDPGIRAELVSIGGHYSPLADGWILNTDSD